MKIFGIILFISLLNLGISEVHLTSDDQATVYAGYMRTFVQGISSYCKQFNSNFAIIPQNGANVGFPTLSSDFSVDANYVAAIDGQAQEQLFYGYDNNDDAATPVSQTNEMNGFLTKLQNQGVKIIVVDYVSTKSKVDTSYSQNAALGYISFAANDRELRKIPTYPSPIYNENTINIKRLSDAKNWLYLINDENYGTKAAFISAVSATNYDVILMDGFFQGDGKYTAQEIAQLKKKKNGASRLVISYMSIGEAENYRYYWKKTWAISKPAWLGPVNPDWGGNYQVRFWMKDWQDIIFGNDTSYSKYLIDCGFDGVYLDIIDAFQYWADA